VEPHGHFVCEKCGAVTDFPVRLGLLEADLPERALVRHMEVLLSGLCEKCL
jgi:Fe2+ or Zn2+ uptake regulation protein